MKNEVHSYACTPFEGIAYFRCAGLIAAGLVSAFLQAPALAVPGDTPEVMYSWDMSVDPGWEMEGEWAFGVPTGEGGDFFFSRRAGQKGRHFCPKTVKHMDGFDELFA